MTYGCKKTDSRLEITYKADEIIRGNVVISCEPTANCSQKTVSSRTLHGVNNSSRKTNKTNHYL